MGYAKRLLQFIEKATAYLFYGTSAIFSIILGLILLVIIMISYSNFSNNKFRYPKPFDPVIWQQTNPQELEGGDKIYNRCYMYKDLVKNQLHFGMDYEKVIKILGNPSRISYYSIPVSKVINYYLGSCRQEFSINTGGAIGYSFELIFDHNSKLIAFGHRDDWHKKKWQVFSKEKDDLFFCYADGECARFVENPGHPHRKIEECKKSEVKSKWGYELW